MTDYDPGNPRHVRERDNRTLEELAAADGALIRALQVMPNSVHTSFDLPRDAGDVSRCHEILQIVMAGAEAKQREGDEARPEPDA